MATIDALSWDDLRLFLDAARLGGLTAATTTTGLSAATLAGGSPRSSTRSGSHSSSGGRPATS